MVTNHYLEKRTFLRKYIRLEKKLSRTKKTSSRYSSLKNEAIEEKRKFYNSKIDEIITNWNEYGYCPGRRWHRAIMGLVKTVNEIQKF